MTETLRARAERFIATECVSRREWCELVTELLACAKRLEWLETHGHEHCFIQAAFIAMDEALESADRLELTP